MSGVCAALAWDGRPMEAGAVERMAGAAGHRALHGVHPWSDGAVVLAHLATHVTPEDRRERQPLVRGGYVLVCDARVDNRDELTAVLGSGGLVPPQPTDADLLLAAHARWGTAAPSHVVGDYAYVVWEATPRSIVAVRDPMGMRALYYANTGRTLLLATEAKQLLAMPGVSHAIDEDSVVRFLAGDFGCLDRTFYADVRQVEPGAALVFAEGRLRTRATWSLAPPGPIRYRDEREYAEHFRDVFATAVRARARASGPLGVLLSGGVDSNAIASTLGWLRDDGTLPSDRPVHTYSWAFETLPECDERHISDRTVQAFGFTPHEVAVDAAAPLEGYPEYGPDLDEPFVGVYQAAIERSLEAARADGVTVMLSGDRGDLVCGAFSIDYLALVRARSWRALAGELREHAALPGHGPASVLARYVAWPALRRLVAGGGLRLVRRAVQRVSGRAAPPAGARGHLPPWVDPERVRHVRCEDGNQARQDPELPSVAALRRDLILAPMHMRGMVWSERTCARYGLAFADPWSDRRVAEYVLAIPQQVLDRPGQLQKRLVREAMRGVMPESVRTDATKIVPSPLYRRSLRERAVHVVSDLVTEGRAAERGFVDESALREHYDAVRAGGRDHAMLWWTLALEWWLRAHVPAGEG